MSKVTHITDAASGEPLISRAFAAYYRTAAREGGTSPPIPASDSYLCELDGKRYVVLHNINGVLAVYRVRNDGMLKGLRRWPRELEEQ